MLHINTAYETQQSVNAKTKAQIAHAITTQLISAFVFATQLVQIKIIVRSFGSSKNTKLEDGPYCTISGNEPSSVTLYKTGSESQTFCCNFKNLHLCSLNQRLKIPKGPNNQSIVKKMILNI